MKQTAKAIHGTYCIQLYCPQQAQIQVGKLGSFSFAAGYYLYIGSAFGPGGVHARLKHHCRLSLKPHWHLDYLRRYADVENAWYVADQRSEHRWSECLEAVEDLHIPVEAFGSSDCSCKSHLFVSDKALTSKILRKHLGEKLISLDYDALLNG